MDHSRRHEVLEVALVTGEGPKDEINDHHDHGSRLIGRNLIGGGDGKLGDVHRH